MAVKKGSKSRARKPAARRKTISPRSKTLHKKLMKLYSQKVDLDLQIFALQLQLATNRDGGGTFRCVQLN